MVRKASENPLNWKTALVFSSCISFILNFLVLLTALEVKNIPGTEHLMSALYGRSVLRFLANTATLFLLYMFCFKIINSGMKPHKKALSIIFGCILISIIFSTVFSLLVSRGYHMEFLAGSRYSIFILIKDLIVAIVVLLTTLLIHIANLRQQTMVENEKLSAENIRNRYEALKNQVDPHFLFNSLNTLNGLIGYDDVRAHDYVEKLSFVFRYTIQNKEITKLYEELDYTESYNYLMKIRYGENLRIENEIDEKYLEYYVMPISLQLLIENAIKHNVISNRYPLVIKIRSTKSQTLIVENNIQPKTMPSAGTGIGLPNLVERYKLLSQQEVIITNTDNVFRVEIPLIAPNKKEFKLSAGKN